MDSDDILLLTWLAYFIGALLIVAVAIRCTKRKPRNRYLRVPHKKISAQALRYMKPGSL